MTNEPLPGVAAGAVVPTEPAAQPTLDLDALLADETQADTPVKLSDLKPWLEQRTGKLVEQVQTDVRTRYEQADRDRLAQEERQATAQSDREFARQIERGLAPGATEDERTAATRAKDENRQRYLRGLAVDFEAESAATREQAVSAHMQPLLAHVHADGKFQPFLDELADANNLAPHNGNWLLMGLRRADQMGYERGKAEAEAAADQTRRINEGAGGPPALSAPSAGGGSDDDLWEGIDRNQRGASALYNQRLAQRRAQQGARR